MPIDVPSIDDLVYLLVRTSVIEILPDASVRSRARRTEGALILVRYNMSMTGEGFTEYLGAEQHSIM
jgi:hypothetical protein